MLFVDSDGLTPAHAVSAGVGFVIGAISGAVAAAGQPDASLKSIGKAAAIGGIGGAISGAVLNPYGAVAIGSAAGVVGNVAGQVASGTDIQDADLGEAAVSGILGAASAGAGSLAKVVVPRIGVVGEGTVAGTVEIVDGAIFDFGEAIERSTIIIGETSCYPADNRPGE